MKLDLYFSFGSRPQQAFADHLWYNWRCTCGPFACWLRTFGRVARCIENAEAQNGPHGHGRAQTPWLARQTPWSAHQTQNIARPPKNLVRGPTRCQVAAAPSRMSPTGVLTAHRFESACGISAVQQSPTPLMAVHVVARVPQYGALLHAFYIPKPALLFWAILAPYIPKTTIVNLKELHRIAKNCKELQRSGYRTPTLHSQNLYTWRIQTLDTHTISQFLWTFLHFASKSCVLTTDYSTL